MLLKDKPRHSKIFKCLFEQKWVELGQSQIGEWHSAGRSQGNALYKASEEAKKENLIGCPKPDCL